MKLIEIFLIGVLILVAGLLLLGGLTLLFRRLRDARSPRLERPARVLSLRREISLRGETDGELPRGGFFKLYTPCFFVRFRTAEGAEPEFRIPGEVFSALAEGEEGLLCSQGSRFLSFEKRSAPADSE